MPVSLVFVVECGGGRCALQRNTHHTKKWTQSVTNIIREIKVKVECSFLIFMLVVRRRCCQFPIPSHRRLKGHCSILPNTGLRLFVDSIIHDLYLSLSSPPFPFVLLSVLLLFGLLFVGSSFLRFSPFGLFPFAAADGGSMEDPGATHPETTTHITQTKSKRGYTLVERCRCFACTLMAHTSSCLCLLSGALRPCPESSDSTIRYEPSLLSVLFLIPPPLSSFLFSSVCQDRCSPSRCSSRGAAG